MSNVINFPVDKTKKLDPLAEFIEELAEDIASDVLSFLLEEGIDFDSDRDVYDISLFYESCKSMLCKFHDRRHPMQSLAHDMYNFSQDEQVDAQLSFDF